MRIASPPIRLADEPHYISVGSGLTLEKGQTFSQYYPAFKQHVMGPFAKFAQACIRECLSSAKARLLSTLLRSAERYDGIHV